MLFQCGKRNGSRNKVEKKVHVDVKYETRVAMDELSSAVRIHVTVFWVEDGGRW
jgi:hypothetical protein